MTKAPRGGDKSPQGDVFPTIPARFVEELLGRVDLSPEARAACLAEAGIPEDALSNPRFRSSAAQFSSLYLAARRAGQDELFGYFERKVPPGSYASLVRILTRCSDVAAG